MKRILSTHLLAVGLFVAGAPCVLAAELRPYDVNLHKAAAKANDIIVLEFHADWCPVCRRQFPAINSVLGAKGFEKVVGFKVDYDEDDTLRTKYRVAGQSTLIVLKGDREIARDQGVTDPSAIRALIKRAF